MFNRRRVRSREENGTTSAVDRTIFKYNATSGDRIFRGSCVPEFLNELQRANPSHAAMIVSCSAMIRASQLITHPAHLAIREPVNCNDSPLYDSYLLPGGPASSPPWPPTDYTAYPTITLHSAAWLHESPGLRAKLYRCNRLPGVRCKRL
jgi:hypothetical protein